MEAEEMSKPIMVWVAQQPSRSGIPSQSKSQTRFKVTLLEKSLHYPGSVPARNLNKLAKKHSVMSLRLCSPPENGPWYVHIVLRHVHQHEWADSFWAVTENIAVTRPQGRYWCSWEMKDKMLWHIWKAQESPEHTDPKRRTAKTN